MKPPAAVVVGAGLAGGTAAASLRDNGFAGPIVLVGEESPAPYERPPLSKEYLAGTVGFERCLLRPEEYWATQEIECRLGVRALSVDAAARTVTLDDGEALAYGQLLVTTGLRNRRLGVPGGELSGIHYLRTVADADAIRAGLPGAARAVVVGMGFIGAEVAATLRTAGLEVDVIEPFPSPVYRGLGAGIGAMLAAIHRDHGVGLHFQQTVAAFEGGDRVERVVTSSGERFDCDLVVVGIGTVAETGLLDGTGVRIDNGIVVDQYCATTVEGIYAAGDVANHFHPRSGRHVRVEHWQNALKQGAAAAASMAGSRQPYNEVHWFWSDQYANNLQVAGTVGELGEAVVRGSLEERNFAAFWLQNGRLAGAVSLNRGRDLRRSLALLDAQALVDPAVLADPEADVRSAELSPGGKKPGP